LAKVKRLRATVTKAGDPTEKLALYQINADALNMVPDRGDSQHH